MTDLSQPLQDPFRLFLFYRDDDTAGRCVEAGIDGLIVDLESRGKARRQSGFDTQINDHTLDTLRHARSRFSADLLCRIDSTTARLDKHLYDVINAGADEIILPMVETFEQAQHVVRCIDGATRITVMVETVAATAIVEDLCTLPIDRIYVGLNDLCIQRRSPHIFSPLADGMLERIGNAARTHEFGFGGLTLPGGGFPLPCHHLVNEMARLDCSFTYLRRSFYRDTENEDIAAGLGSVRQAIAAARERERPEIDRDRNVLLELLEDEGFAIHA